MVAVFAVNYNFYACFCFAYFRIRFPVHHGRGHIKRHHGRIQRAAEEQMGVNHIPRLRNHVLIFDGTTYGVKGEWWLCLLG